MSDITAHQPGQASGEETFVVGVLRQDGPGQDAYWERHAVAHGPDMTTHNPSTLIILGKIPLQFLQNTTLRESLGL